MEHHLSKIDEMTHKIVSACFPSYKGKKVILSTNIPTRLESYWDGGSRNQFVFYELATGKTHQVHSNHPFFESNQPSVLKSLPIGFCVVMHQIFCGKDMGITIFANTENLTPLLPQNTNSELPLDEKIVLIATRSFKSSYAGISNYRFIEARRETGITKDRWENAKTSLIQKGLLNKASAITAAGRNVVGWKQLHELKSE